MTLAIRFPLVPLAAAVLALGGCTTTGDHPNSRLPAVSPVRGVEIARRPEVWMMPPSLGRRDGGRVFRELFTHPDEWTETRKRIDVLGYSSGHMRQFTDEELREWFPQLDRWGLKLGFETGVVKPQHRTGAEAFASASADWDRTLRLGGKIYAVAFDEPLYATRTFLHLQDSYGVEETAQFIRMARARYPGVKLGDIEPYPSIPLASHLAWIDALQARLKALGVAGLDFYRLDVNWVNFVVANAPGNWREMKELETACRSRGIPFSLIYWASEQPELLKRGLSDDSTWYVGIMEQGYAYRMVKGDPDQYVLESWIGMPKAGVPETADWTFTRSVLDFCNKFVPGR